MSFKGNKKRIKSRRSKLAFLSVVMLLIVFTSAFLTVAATGYGGNDGFVLSFQPIGSEAAPFIDEGGDYALTKPDGRDLKILHLTDIHIGGGLFSVGLDKKTYTAIYKLTEYARPDLIIVTGDIVYPVSVQSGNLNNARATEQFCAFMDNLEIPWTVTLGNHDSALDTTAGRSEVADIYASEKLEYCLFLKNPEGENISGFGNHLINIRDTSGKLIQTIIMLDTNTTIKGAVAKYDSVHDDQVEWYKKSLTRLSSPENGISEGETVPSLLFFHMPLYEYDLATKLAEAGSDEAEIIYGSRYRRANPEKSAVKSGLFDAMVELESTKAAFCGHIHKNNYAVRYKGIQLTYGYSVVYLSFNIKNKEDYRGGTLITLDGSGGVDCVPFLLKDIN